MAREKKPLQLRTVDDSNPEPTPVVRLDNRETAWRASEPKPVRLGPGDELPGVSQRLDLPDRDEVELRTHQPGIDVLIEPEEAVPEPLEENWGEAAIRRYPIPWGWFVLIGLAIIAAVLWSLIWVRNSDPKAYVIRTQTVTALSDEEQEEREASQLVDRIDKTLREFVTCTSVETLARHVRQPERVIPLMRRYYADKPVFSGLLKRIRVLQPLTLENRGDFWMAGITLGDGEVKNLVLEIDKSGEPLVDWETFVCYQPMEWDDFATRKPTGTSLDFRVYVENDDFYSHEFSDSEKWDCFRLTALGGEHTLFGYTRNGSAASEEILRLIESNGGRRVSLILRLGVPEGLQSRSGVVIEKLLCSRWLYLDPPDPGT